MAAFWTGATRLNAQQGFMGAVKQAQAFCWPVRIYYESTDAGGVVYHAEYLKFFERARSEWLRSLGFEHTKLRDQASVVFVVRSMQIKFVQPARFDDMLEVTSKMVESSRCRLVFEQKLSRGDDVLTTAIVEVASVDSVSFKPVTIPAGIREKMEIQ
jgi:acyl-CoA thioester hydrolase